MTTFSEKICFTSPATKNEVSITLDPLPDVQEIVNTFIREKAFLKHWIQIARFFYEKSIFDGFVEIMEKSRDSANSNYPNSENDQMILLDTLAAHYVNLARSERNKDAKREFFIRATRLYTAADKIVMLNENHLIGRAYLCLLESDKLDQADTQFNFVLDQNPENIPALFGKARVYLARNEFRLALSFYRKVLELFPEGLVASRIGIGICLHKLGKIDLAKIAFERAVELDPSCILSVTALALLRLNEKSSESVKSGMQALSTAYTIYQDNPTILSILADHFFHKQDYTKTLHLASLAVQHTNNDITRSFALFLLARVYHAQSNYDNAFNYYYQSSQTASPRFVLPFYGLAQLHLIRGEINDAITNIEKVLAVSPNNIEAIKLACVCYLKSSLQEYSEKAKNLYRRVVETCPDEEDSWIGFAEVLQYSNFEEANDAYFKAISIMESKNIYITPELYNNIGSVYFRLGDYGSAKTFFELAMTRVEESSVLTDSSPITATIRYNFGRVLENTFEIEKAENLYKDVIKDFPEYIDCYLRLGQLSKFRGDYKAASEWFNSALRVDSENPEIWLHIAALHMLRQEFGPAQKKFEKVSAIDKSNPDPYAWLSLGNIWLTLLHSASKDPEKRSKFSERALSIYKGVLKRDPSNIFAANGIGCVLAYSNHFSQARDIFSQCREATSEFPDIWFNLGHVYVEGKQFTGAVKMYEGCHERFFSKAPDQELLLCLARAHFKSDSLVKARRILLKILFLNPYNLIALYNLSLVLERAAEHILKSDRSTLNRVKAAIFELELSIRNFSFLAGQSESSRIDPAACELEKRSCSDLITQATHKLESAYQRHEAESEMLRIHKEQLSELARRRELQEEQEKQLQKEREQELIRKRTEYLKNAQQSLLNIGPEEEKHKTTKIQKNKDEEKKAKTNDDRKRNCDEKDRLSSTSSDLDQQI